MRGKQDKVECISNTGDYIGVRENPMEKELEITVKEMNVVSTIYLDIDKTKELIFALAEKLQEMREEEEKDRDEVLGLYYEMGGV